MSMRELADAAGLVAVTILLAILAWLFLVATDEQNSAECDYWAVKFEKAGAR